MGEVLSILRPFKPIIDVLRAPIPIISDVAVMVGQPPVTLLTLLEVVAENDLTLLKRILALADDETKIIAGRGPLASKKDLKAAVEMLADASERVRKLVDAGKSEEEILALPDVHFTFH